LSVKEGKLDDLDIWLLNFNFIRLRHNVRVNWGYRGDKRGRRQLMKKRGRKSKVDFGLFWSVLDMKKEYEERI
jgi:hypothetical protein